MLMTEARLEEQAPRIKHSRPAVHLEAHPMKPGAQYERFVYDKLQRLFPEARVVLNDKIPGLQSGLKREIDVSIRLSAAGTDVLYIVQCKDWADPVDINTLGALSAVMQDVGAAKAFMLCTSGFYKTNHKYALTQGIELVTIEDINSEKWSVAVEIPFVYIRKSHDFALSFQVVANQALVERNRNREIQVNLMAAHVRAAGFSAETPLQEYVVTRARELITQGQHGAADITPPGMEIAIDGIWVPLTGLTVATTSNETHYVKYLSPAEYSQLRDHVRGTTIPLHVKLQMSSTDLDDGFVQVPTSLFAKFPGLLVTVEESYEITGLDVSKWEIG